MRLRLIFLLLPFSFFIAHANNNERFLQEIATVFTSGDGLPVTTFLDIRFGESGKIIAVTPESEFIYDGETWKIISTSSDLSTKEKKEFEGDLLSQVEYQKKVFIGKKDGLFMKGKQKDEWIEIFPSDRNYSWKLSNVSVLLADSKDRL